MDGKSDGDVLAFDMHDDSIFSRIPRGLERFFPNLIILRWAAGNLAIMNADDLRPFPELISLSISGNRFTSLSANIFRFSLKLQRLHFQGNFLEHAGNNLLVHSPLTFVDFRRNNCIDMLGDTPASIMAIRVRLQTHCSRQSPPEPPNLTTTTISTISTTPSDECQTGCSMKIDNLEQEISEFRDEVSDYKRRIEELERQMREMISNPCSSCSASNNVAKGD